MRFADITAHDDLEPCAGLQWLRKGEPNIPLPHSLNRGDEMKQTEYPRAFARIRGGREWPMICGTVTFTQRCDGVLVEAALSGLPRTESGFFAFHIHEGGSCTGDGFPNTGGHFNPDGTEHPNHAGDLPPLMADFGNAYMKVLTGRFHVEQIIGRTVILHSNPDDFHTQPSGNAGTKIACGVIQRI